MVLYPKKNVLIINYGEKFGINNKVQSSTCHCGMNTKYIYILYGSQIFSEAKEEKGISWLKMFKSNHFILYIGIALISMC
jgi:hypothetical protein